MRRIRSWWRDLFRRRQLDAELDDEIRYHIEREIEELVAAGVSRPEARRRALAEFGAVAAIKEEVRETRATHRVESLWLDVRFGARALRRDLLFALTGVATLALTIGSVTTVLTIAHAFFLRPLPVADAERVVEVRVTRDDGASAGFVSYPDYAAFRDGAATLEGLAAVYMGAPLFISSGEEAYSVTGAVVTANFFPLLGLEPAAGRFFAPREDEVPGRDPVAVLDHGFWMQRFAGREVALGEQLDINGVKFTIIGVSPPDFHGIGTTAPQVYMPTMMLPVGYRWCSVLHDADCTILRMYGRMAEGVGLDVASAELTALVPERWRDAAPGDNDGVAVVTARATEVGDTTENFLALLGAVSAALLLVCCANLAGLLTSRAGGRARELAIRTSLGAPRARLVRQMLTESILLALAGGVAGVALSRLLTGVLRAAFYATDSSGRPYYVDLAIAPQVIGVVLTLAFGCGLLFGVLPAIVSARLGGRMISLRATVGSVSARTRAARWLVGAQTAGAVVFVVIAGLLVSSAGALLAGANFDPSGVALIRLRPRLVDYEPERAQPYLRRVVEQLEALPEVESVTLVGTGVALWGLSADVSLPGTEDAGREVGYLEVGPGYFETLRTPVLRGRGIEAEDDAAAPAVAVVNETLASTLWPGGDAIGDEVVVGARRYSVIGVVADVDLQNRVEGARPYLYTAFWQSPGQVDARLQIRVNGEAEAMLPRLLREASRVDPAVPVSEPLTLTRRVAGYLQPVRMGAAVVSYAGMLAVLLSALGVYAALAAGVTARNHELGVRMAVGASAGDVFRMIVGQGGATIAAGIGIGLLAAVGAARLLQHLLYGSAAGDGTLFVGAAVIVAGVGVAASVIPALRAARTEPLRALKPR